VRARSLATPIRVINSSILAVWECDAKPIRAWNTILSPKTAGRRSHSGLSGEKPTVMISDFVAPVADDQRIARLQAAAGLGRDDAEFSRLMFDRVRWRIRGAPQALIQTRRRLNVSRS